MHVEVSDRPSVRVSDRTSIRLFRKAVMVVEATGTCLLNSPVYNL